MSGIDNHNFTAFNEAAQNLRNLGYEVLNPAENDGGSHDKEWHYYMSLDFTHVCKADVVMVLPGWENSEGANAEVLLAHLLRRPVQEYTTGKPIIINLTERQIRVSLRALVQSALNSPKDETTLQEADRLVSTDRQSTYGHPLKDFLKTSIMWTGALIHKLKPGEFIQPEEVGLMMALVKVSRQLNGHKRDNLVDGAGYFKTVDLCNEARTEGVYKEWLQKISN
jgi:hypothetical protein